MADDYIRKQDAIGAIHCDIKITGRENAETVCKTIKSFTDGIKSLEPADVVPVVRCKDCKYNATTHKCLNPDSFFLIPKDDDFCSYGTRREE